MKKIDEIIIHCADTPEGRKNTAKDIDKWHRDRNFRCIGYHYVVLLDGTVEAGRKETEIGAHCTGHNDHSIGICYIGGRSKDGKPKDTRTQAQKEALEALLKELKGRYPDATLHGHNEFADKSCPSFDVRTDYLQDIWKSL